MRTRRLEGASRKRRLEAGESGLESGEYEVPLTTDH